MHKVVIWVFFLTSLTALTSIAFSRETFKKA
jgi:hypothetical protein